MVLIKDLGNGNYQTFPITDDMIEVEDIDAWVEENRPSSMLNEERIFELKKNLADTDWVVVKISELMIDSPELAEQLKSEYAEVLALRKQWREEINQLQEE